jgi:TM2 domain-containing membrane protein YozV
MTDRQDWGQPPQYRQRGYGQQYPQGQPRQPLQYGPTQHQQRVQGPPPGYGQVQPYMAPPPYQGHLPYAQPQYAPPVAPKSTGTGLVLGLLLPGVGCMYAGRVGIGVLIMGIWLISIPLVFVFGIGVLTGLGTWIASSVLGYTMTRGWNAAHGIVSLSAEQRRESARLLTACVQVQLHRSVEAAWNVCSQVADRHPLHRIYLLGVHDAGLPRDHDARSVGQAHPVGRVDALAEHLPGFRLSWCFRVVPWRCSAAVPPGRR